MADEIPVIGELKAHALAYGEEGLEVFPVEPATKQPMAAHVRGAPSQYGATTDADTIAAWWDRWPHALIGHRLPEDHVVIDVDPRHGGLDTWNLLVAELGFDPLATRVHMSGRGDRGGHATYLRPEGRLTISKLDAWAKERGVGHQVEGATDRWVCGLDLLHRTHRYTILPPSPHPDTGKPYTWRQWRDPEPMPPGLADLLIDAAPPPPPRQPVPYNGESIADWYSETRSWNDLLPRHGWTLRAGDGDSDGSQWRHPTATTPISATVRHGCLFTYSPNTPFPVTAPDDPHGVTRFAAFALLDHGGDLSAAGKSARELKDGRNPTQVGATSVGNHPQHLPLSGTSGLSLSGTPVSSINGEPIASEEWQAEHDEAAPPFSPVNWAELFAGDGPDAEWVAEPLLPKGRQVALWASHKAGKSLLTLEVAAALATGRRVLLQPAGEPIDVLYLDMEMTEDDLRERLEDMGYSEADDLSRLHYYLIPPLAELDTARGGDQLMWLVEHHGAEAVILDTMSRFTEGEENSADTYRAFYRHTGQRLKAAGISVLRLDHGGKDADKKQRGSSAKGDDVDVVWQLVAQDSDDLILRRTVSRMSWVPEQIMLRRTDDNGLRHAIVGGTGTMWPKGTHEVAQELERIGVPQSASQSEAYRAAAEAGLRRRKALVMKAQKYRFKADPVGVASSDETTEGTA